MWSFTGFISFEAPLDVGPQDDQTECSPVPHQMRVTSTRPTGGGYGDPSYDIGPDQEVGLGSRRGVEVASGSRRRQVPTSQGRSGRLHDLDIERERSRADAAHQVYRM